MRTCAAVCALTMFLFACTDSGVQISSENDEPVSTLSPTTSSTPVPNTNAEGEITGDPYAQCEITQPTAQPDPPYCVGDPDFEWERAPTMGEQPGGGWLTEGVLLSDREESFVTVGFRLSEGCVIDRLVVEETEEAVTVGLHYWAFDDEIEQGCANGDKKWALRGYLDAALGERELIVRPLE